MSFTDTLLLVFLWIVSNLVFLLVGYWSGNQTLTKKLEVIRRIQHKQTTGGIVTPPSPQELEKQQAKAFRDKYNI